MLQEVLKQATDKQHQDLEQLMFVDQIMNGTLSLEQYKEILHTNYIVHACVEQYLFTSLDQELKTELDLDKRTKLPALQKDLQELNMEVPEVECADLEQITDAENAALLGVMYVLEGATLGGNVVVKRLKVNQNLKFFNLNFNYYQVYGTNLVDNWKQFCRVLNTRVDKTEYDASIKSALSLFEQFASAKNKNLTKQGQ